MILIGGGILEYLVENNENPSSLGQTGNQTSYLLLTCSSPKGKERTENESNVSKVQTTKHSLCSRVSPYSPTNCGQNNLQQFNSWDRGESNITCHMKANSLEASEQPTKCCHLSSILPAATQRLSLCKTDICPEAFFLFSFSFPFFFFFFFDSFLVIYVLESTTTITPGILLQLLKVSAFVRNQGKMSAMKDDLKFCDAEDFNIA